MVNAFPNRGSEHFLRCKAAEWAVASQLALRGHLPMFPPVDLGVDIVLDNGLRLQVKSATLRENNTKLRGVNKNCGYMFELRRGAWYPKEKKYKKSNLRPYSEIADFFVLWGVEENRFFILSTAHKRQRIWFNSKNAQPSRSQNRRTFDQITEERVKEFEDRWDLLDINSVRKTVESAEQIMLSNQESQNYTLSFDLQEKI